MSLDQLDQQTVVVAWVDERDHVPPAPRPRGLVDQLDALRLELLQCGLEILDFVGDVMEAP